MVVKNPKKMKKKLQTLLKKIHDNLDIRYQEPDIATRYFQRFNTFYSVQLILAFIIHSYTKNVLKIYTLLKMAQGSGFRPYLEDATI